MSEFEYLSVLISIIVALALSEIFSGWGRMIRHRDHVTVYWVHLLAMAISAVFIIQYWWAAWLYKGIVVDFFDYFVILLAPLTFVLLALVITPQISETSTRDCRAYYFKNCRWIYFLAVLVLLELVVADLVIRGEFPITVRNLIRVIAMIFLLLLGYFKNEWFHGITLVTLAVLQILFMALNPLFGAV